MRDKILKQLRTQKVNSKLGWRIYFEHEMLVMNSGKYVWEKRGHAKNALIHSLKDTIPKWRGFYQEVENLHSVVDGLLTLGIIEIIYEQK